MIYEPINLSFNQWLSLHFFFPCISLIQIRIAANLHELITAAEIEVTNLAYEEQILYETSGHISIYLLILICESINLAFSFLTPLQNWVEM
jgi:hypothetical protein